MWALERAPVEGYCLQQWLPHVAELPTSRGRRSVGIWGTKISCDRVARAPRASVRWCVWWSRMRETRESPAGAITVTRGSQRECDKYLCDVPRSARCEQACSQVCCAWEAVAIPTQVFAH